MLDLTRLLPGPFCTRLLADLGAEVVKMEDRGAGDYMRHTAPDLFEAMNHGKRGIAFDLRNAEDRAEFLRLAPGFDVFVEGFRPGVMARLGAGYEQLRIVHPTLVYCSISGYGQSGTRAARSGHDINYMSQAGLLSGAAGPFTVPVADFCGGYAAALRIAAALHPEKSKRGCYIDLSMTDSVLAMALTRMASDRLEGALACYNLYRTADGRQYSLGALEPKFFAAFTKAVGRPELVEMQFDAARQAELKAILAGIFATKASAEWDRFFESVDACGAAVLTPQEATRG